MTETTIKDILPSDIIFDAGTQARVRTDIKTCHAYIESMKDGVEFPPLDVFNDGTSPKYVLGDGFHRLQSHCSFRPNEPIKCRVHLGTVKDARIFAAGANATHGLRRTNEDKRKAVKIVLTEPKCQDWSDSRIAEHVKVSIRAVGRIRLEIESTLTLSKSRHRVGKDGRTINTANIGLKSKRPRLSEPSEPKSHIRKNADGKEVNTKGYDFRDHRRCDQCDLWDLETGLCARDDSPQPSWTPACTDWRKRHSDLPPDMSAVSQRVQTKAAQESHRSNGSKAAYVRSEHVLCKLYPDNAELSAVEIRHVMGEEYLLALLKAIKLVMDEE